jgi:hypothetical protein
MMTRLLFFLSAEVEEMYLTPLPIFAPHANFYVREMRIKAYTQILESYKSLTLERMSNAFGVSATYIDAWVFHSSISCRSLLKSILLCIAICLDSLPTEGWRARSTKSQA